MKPTLYSIIIPHYNIPELLMRCLHSIPVREDVQVIVVDDCSPDAATYRARFPELSRPYLEYYSTPEGGSAGRARNIGVEHARGRWLMFVDSDDLLPDDIEKTFDEWTDRPEDLIIMNFRQVLSDDLNVAADRDVKCRSILDHGIEEELRYKYDPLWGKLIKRELVSRHHIRFDHTRWGNDCYFSLCVGIHAHLVCAEPRVGYIVTERHNSLASNIYGSIEEAAVRLDVALRMTDLMRTHHIDTQYSHLWYIDRTVRERFSRWDRLRIALRLWRHRSYMIYLIRH